MHVLRYRLKHQEIVTSLSIDAGRLFQTAGPEQLKARAP